MSTPIAEPKLMAFLDLIAWSEGTSTHPHTTADGYDVIVTGALSENLITDYRDHPFAAGRAAILVHEGPPRLYSTASGRYQIRLETWRFLVRILGLLNFQPANQDLGGLELIKSCGAITAILVGNLPFAFQRVCNTWASFPGNLFNQPTHPTDILTAKYAEYLVKRGAR